MPRYLVGTLVLAAGLVAGDVAPLKAQAAPAAGDAQQALPAVVVEGRRQQAPKRNRARAQRSAPAPAAAPQAPSAPTETATGPVQGYLANQSATGLKTDTPLRETPQSITVVSEQRIRDQGSTTVQEAIRYVPGVLADAYGPDSRNEATRVRGSSPDVYLDGMRVVNAWFNEPRQDPYTLSRIEVLRGPSSMIYGSSTTAGILNLISKRPQDETHREIVLQYGSFDRKQVQTDWTGKITDDGKWLYRFVGVFRDSNYQTDFVKDDRATFAPSITWRPTENTTWTILGLYQKDKTGSSTAFLPIEGTLYPGPNGRIPVNRFSSDPSFDRYETEVGAITSLFEHRFSDAFKIQQHTRYAHTKGIYNTMYPDVYANPANPFVDPARRSVYRYVYGSNSTRDALTSDTNAEMKFGTGPIAHKVLLGADVRQFNERSASGYGYDTTPFDLYAPVYSGVVSPVLSVNPDLSQRQTGVYVQDQMRLGSWIAVLGLRQDWVRNDAQGSPLQKDKATTGRVALMYELPFGLTPYVSYAQSFNPIFGASTCVDFCKPMRGEQVEAGFKYNPWKGTAINGALFDVTEKNRLAAGPIAFGPSIQTGQVRIRGAELEVISSLTDDFDVVGAYSYLDAKIESGDNAGKRIETVPMHQASMWAKHKFALFGHRGFTVGAGVRYVGESWDGKDEIRTPDYALFDAMLSYETGPWRWQLNAANLADKQHVTTCLARGDCFYGSRRTILSSLTYKF